MKDEKIIIPTNVEELDKMETDLDKIINGILEEPYEYYGIQLFDNSKEAFSVMDDVWGEKGLDCYSKIVIGEQAFLEEIFDRVVYRYADFINGKISEEELNLDLGQVNGKSTQYLLDFNYFVYDTNNDVYLTSRMGFKDDFESEWSYKQWDIYFYIINTYDLINFVKFALIHIKNFIEKDGGYDRIEDPEYTMLFNNCKVEFFERIKNVNE